MIEIHTNSPRGLVRSINAAIDEGRIATWSYDEDGDYIHNRTQWIGKAWMSPMFDDADDTLLRFCIVEPKIQKLSRSSYAVYHGRFVEMLLTYFDREIISISVSPMLTRLDFYDSTI